MDNDDKLKWSSEDKPIITNQPTDTNELLNGNDVDVDILPKVGGNSIIINVCSCFNWSYSVSDKPRKN